MLEPESCYYILWQTPPSMPYTSNQRYKWVAISNPVALLDLYFSWSTLPVASIVMMVSNNYYTNNIITDTSIITQLLCFITYHLSQLS